MTIKEFIEKLEDAEQNAKCLGKHTGLSVEMYKGIKGFNLYLVDKEEDEVRYSFDFDDIDSMNNHMEAMCIGAMLAKGLEV